MIPRIKSILYATDLTDNSAYAFRYAVNSAQKHDAKIHILHVLEKPHSSVGVLVELHFEEGQLEKLWKERRDEQIKRINQRLKEFAERELKNDQETLKRVASIVVIEGEPAVEILRKADELDCDVIIMGTHGKGWITHAFLGSVAEKVLSRVKKPVYIIPIPKGETDITFKNT